MKTHCDKVGGEREGDNIFFKASALKTTP